MKITKQEFLVLTGVDPETLYTWLDEKWLVPDKSSTEITFSEIDIARAYLVRDLHDRMGINEAGVGVVLDLVDQLHGLRKTLLELRYVIEAPVIR